ncbi:methylated-DNA--[protein]-cysteine S-methyltransferase [Haloimpatiens sp. FM7315]|uniref:methylated-DNA--[protein]-cysteine S-methyltransferase n=1 Tax=Haloimpatiens sp. FM7315 TaxID=3298609 RepID=UPI0035A29824
MNKLYYGYYSSPVGILKITASKYAVTSLVFTHDLFVNKQVPSILKKTFKELDEYFNGERKYFSINIEMEGTEFQKKAWKFISEIPYGETRTYKEQAIAIGNPKAARAVGNANNKNPLSIIIPCHRVIGSNGKLTGYAFGVNKKKWLLEHEKINV